MLVYCVHAQREHYANSKYNRCPVCRAEWYDMEPTPIVIIGTTEVEELENNEETK